MTERRKATLAPSTAKLPLYRRWWVVAATGIVLFGAATAIVYAARPGINYDQVVTYKP